MATISRYPLSWPDGWPRTPAWERKPARFGTHERGKFFQAMTIAGACQRLFTAVTRLGVPDGDAVLSTNIRTRLDGLPYGREPEPRDVGAALYFRLDATDRVLACDRWASVADNITAIAEHINALRAIDRYGVGSRDQVFAGYTALPAKGSTWRTTLGFLPDQVVTRDEIHAAMRMRAKSAHPDVEGGSHDAMASLTAAMTEGFREVDGA